MVILHTDRLPISEDEVQALEDHIFQAVNDAPSAIHIWESDSSHYHGRDKDGAAHIGINVSRLNDDRGPPPLLDEEDDEEQHSNEERARYVIAHEMGHDIAEKDFKDNNGIPVRDHIEDNKLDATASMDEMDIQDTSFAVSRMVTSELMAELAAEETVAITDPYDRTPFPDDSSYVTDIGEQVADLTAKDFYARNADRVEEQVEKVEEPDAQALDYLNQLPRSEFRETSVFKDSPRPDRVGVKAFVEREGTMERWYRAESDNMDAISYRLDLLENLKEAYQNEEIDIGKMLKLAWAQDAHKIAKEYSTAQKGKRDTPFFEAIDKRLDIDYSQMEDKSEWDLKNDETPADETIYQHRDEIVQEVVQESVRDIKERVESLRKTYGDVIPDPGNRYDFPGTQDMADWLDEEQEIYAEADYDFSHRIGCTIGQILHRRGVTIDEVAQDMDTYRKIAEEAVEETMKEGYQQHVSQPDQPSMHEFEATANFLIDKYVNRDRYSGETDYRAD
jgi:dUTPase